MYPFPSINQFRNIVQKVRHQAAYLGTNEAGEPVYNTDPKFPTLIFTGTVKLHGTNAAVVFESDSITFQSRERVLTLTQDNAGFYAHMASKLVAPVLQNLKAVIEHRYSLNIQPTDVLAIYGEWCGGNIQQNVAISGLPKMFVIFAVKFNDQWLNIRHLTMPTNDQHIRSIYDYPTFFIEINFEKPELAQNKLGEITSIIEASCPVGYAHGSKGIGEGVVWQCEADPSSDYWFKVKGEKHSASKVKTLASVDVTSITQMHEFVEQVVTESRLQQGLTNILNEKMLPFEMTSMGDFIRWVHGDVIKEETDTMLANGIDPKKLGGPLAQVARRWFVDKLRATELASTS